MARLKLVRYEAESGQVPGVCMKCGALATGTDTKTFSWYPPWVNILVLVALLPALIVSSILTKRMKVIAPFCDQHRNHWTWRNRAILVCFLVLLLLGGGVLVLMAVKTLPDAVNGAACAGAIALLVAWGIFAIVLSATSIGVSEITDHDITLTGVGDGFIHAVMQQRQADPYRRHEAYQGPARTSVPWGALGMVGCFVGALFIVVVLAAITTIGRNASTTFQRIQLPEVVDQAEHFRLNNPGPGWILLGRTEAQALNSIASAGARHGDDLYGIVIVEPVQPDLNIAGREEEVARNLIKESPATQKRTESIRAIDFQGNPAVRFRFTGVVSGRRFRYENVLFIYHEKLYQLYCWGLPNRAAPDDSTFQPFFDAFELLPVNGELDKR
jgi:hypothetical protein